MQHTLAIQNIKQTVMTSLTLTYVLHFFACIWIYIGLALEDGWYNKTYKATKENLELSLVTSNVFDRV
jgi:hypothetical protein